MSTDDKGKVLSIRNVSERDARDFAASAAVRGMTQAEYLSALIGLHQFVRRLQWETTEDPTDEDGGKGLWFVRGFDGKEDETVIHHLGTFLDNSSLMAYLA